VPLTLVDQPAAVGPAVAAIAGAPAIALDTETDAFFAYRARICLLQVSIPGGDFLFDPLAGIDLAPLGALVGDPEREIVLHAAENDVILLEHQFGWRIGRLFDTQVACFVLGLRPYSLAGVLEERFGVKLDKRMQRSDWSRRPLERAQVEYAVEDTRHLLALASELHARLDAAGRVEEVASECARIAARTWRPEPVDPEGFRRIDGARSLDRTQLRILRDLWLFREREAERLNRAPYRLLDDRALLAIARARARDWVRGVPRHFWDRYGREVLRVVDAALAQGPLEAAPPRARRLEPLPPEVKRSYDALRRWRSEAAARRGVEPFVVARNEALLDVARRGCRTLRDLGEVLEPFRVREYGEAILAAMLDSAPERAQNAP
jgi:ribonuclease D